ncbi:MAG: hypothetical protein LQ344_005668 [Seirophora lacunosa]|nr:MAG: hypothetical protein LQ344_005668 [Seirophora lacunosa]
MAQDLHSCDLTPEFRLLDNLMKDWHRTTDHEFDLQLDILSSANSVPRNFQYNNCSNHFRNFDWSMPTGKLLAMDEHTQPAEVGLQSSLVTIAEEPQALTREVPVSTLEHATNDFDDPGYHILDPLAAEHPPLAQASSSGVAKLEEAATDGSMTHKFLTAPGAHPNAYVTNGPSRMQRNATAPNLHAPNIWANSPSDGLPASNSSYNQISGVHQGSPSTYHSPSDVNGACNQLRATQTSDFGSSHYLRHDYMAHVPSGLRHSVSEHNGWDQSMTAYSSPYIENVSFPYNPAAEQNEFGYSSLRQSTNSNSHKKVLNSNSVRGENVINNRTVGGHHLHHRNDEASYQMMNQTYPSYHMHPDSPAPKFQRSPSSVTVGGPRSNIPSSKRVITGQQTRQTNTGDEGREGDESEAPEMELLYATIEAARAAERPKIKTHQHKDETIPRGDDAKQTMVKGLYECMYRIDKAEDNPGMIRQWMKLRQDTARVEQAAWRVLRVTNNRKVNASKKTLFDKGKSVARNGSDNKRRRARSVSPEDEGSIAEFGDEDAEGELDEDYGYLPERTGSNYRVATQARPASGSARGYKREREDEDSDYAGGRAKKPRRTARRGPANGSSRKQRQPKGSRSKYQPVLIGDRETMVDVGDLKYEPTILTYGSPEMQARFIALHYPNGRKSELSGSQRSSRAAAPTTFRGLSNSDEVGNDESGSHYGSEDEHYRDAASQHS